MSSNREGIAEDAATGRVAAASGGFDASSDARQRFEALTNLIPQLVWSTTPDGYHDYFNDRWYEYTGMPRTGAQGWNWKNYLHPDDVPRTLEVWHRALATGERYEVRYRFRRARDGAYRWFIGRAMPLRNASGEITRWFGTCTDIHEERRTEEKLERLAEFRRSLMGLVEESLTARHPEEFYQRVLDHAVGVIPGAEAGSMLFRAADGAYEFVAGVGYDVARLRRVRLTEAQIAFGGLRASQPVTITEFGTGAPLDADQQELLRAAGPVHAIKVALSIPVVLEGEITAHLSLDNFRTPDAFDEEATEMARIFAGHLGALVQRFRLERQLHRLAYEDPLTELPNRASLNERIADSLLRAEEAKCPAAVLFIDLDGFKPINDTLGHRAGDEVLRVVARRLVTCTRGRDAVGRLGGDEFTIVLHGVDVQREARLVAERVLQALAQPIVTHDGTVRTSASVGIGVYPTDGSTADEVLQCADLAMYQAKQRGKNTYAFFRREPAGVRSA